MSFHLFIVSFTMQKLLSLSRYICLFYFYFHYSWRWIKKGVTMIYVQECSACVFLWEFYSVHRHLIFRLNFSQFWVFPSRCPKWRRKEDYVDNLFSNILAPFSAFLQCYVTRSLVLNTSPVFCISEENKTKQNKKNDYPPWKSEKLRGKTLGKMFLQQPFPFSFFPHYLSGTN